MSRSGSSALSSKIEYKIHSENTWWRLRDQPKITQRSIIDHPEITQQSLRYHSDNTQRTLKEHSQNKALKSVYFPHTAITNIDSDIKMERLTMWQARINQNHSPTKNKKCSVFIRVWPLCERAQGSYRLHTSLGQNTRLASVLTEPSHYHLMILWNKYKRQQVFNSRAFLILLLFSIAIS